MRGSTKRGVVDGVGREGGDGRERERRERVSVGWFFLLHEDSFQAKTRAWVRVLIAVVSGGG